MNILIIGSGGREHALCWKLNESRSVKKIYCVPGNGGTAHEAKNLSIDISDHAKLASLCKDKEIDLVIVGPEAPLAVGITDDLESSGIKVFGPSYAASRMESSKIFAKEIMGMYNIPTAPFRIFDDFEKAKKYISSMQVPIVVKAYGLAAGKGVIIAASIDEAVKAAESMLIKKIFGFAGERIIVEEFLEGEEVSVLVITDGEKVIPLAASQDHKRVDDGDKGPNTGGMGAYSPTPAVNDGLLSEIMKTIVIPTINGLKSEGIPYKGVLYCGIMLTKDGPKVLEYNVRFGDPETQAILPRLMSDLAELLMDAAKGSLPDKTLEWEEGSSVCVVLASGGYPNEYEKGKEITGISEAVKEGAVVFHAGTEIKDKKILTAGGRVLNVVGKGKNVKEAVDKAYRAVSKIHFDGMHYRKDIAHRALAREK